MTPAVFDVFVVGAADQSATGQARLATALAARLGLHVVQAARGISEKKLRAGQGLAQAQAQALVRELQAQGAVTVVRVAAPAPAQPAPPEPAGIGPQFPAAPGAAAELLFPEPGIDRGEAFTPPPSGQFAAPGTPGSGQRDMFAQPPSLPAIDLLPEEPHAACVGPRSAGPHDVVGASAEHAPVIELEEGRRTSEEMRRAQRARVVPMGAGAEVLSPSSASAPGLAVDQEAAEKLHLVRCHKHGLFYDNRKASGCRKCLDAGHKVAKAMREQTGGFRLGDFSDSPTRRAFAGLALALLIGFVAAAYNAFRIGEREVRLLRDEQEVLARRPGTEETLRRFDELEENVIHAHAKSVRNTALIWLAVSGVSLAVWYKLT